MSVSAVMLVAGWLIGWVVLGRPRTVPRGARSVAAVPPGAAPARLTVIIPARNEEQNISALLAQLGPPDSRAAEPARIVVVDDHSEDETASVARSFPGVEVVHAAALPEGWTGKNWACHSGVQFVRGDDGSPDHRLVFLDADVQLDRSALSRVLDEHDVVGGLVSVEPWHETHRWWEQPSAMFNIVAAMGVGMHGRKPSAGAFGPVLVTTLGDYDRAGGHASVRAEVTEDLALAHRYRALGLGPFVYVGDRRIRFRMYPEGLGQMVEGWSKNFATGASSTAGVRTFAIFLWIVSMWNAAGTLVGAMAAAEPLLYPAMAYLAFALQFGLMSRILGRFNPLTALLFPLLLAFFLVLFVRSVWLTRFRQRVTWRGRAIPTAVPGA